MYSHSPCGVGHGRFGSECFCHSARAGLKSSGCMRSKEIECRLTLQAYLRIEKSRPSKPIVGSINSSRSCRCTEPCLLAIRLAETEVLRRGFLLGDARQSSDEPGHDVIFEYRNADIADHAQLAVRSDVALRHIATNSDGDHSIQCLLNHCPIVGMHDLSVV